MLQNSVNEHGDRSGEEQNCARADSEVPKPLTLASELDAHVDHREADAVEGVEDDGGEQTDFGELK